MAAAGAAFFLLLGLAKDYGGKGGSPWQRRGSYRGKEESTARRERNRKSRFNRPISMLFVVN